MRYLYYILISIILFSCKKEDVISDIPQIEFVSITPATAQEYIDEINIIISYSDANGDLGENNPDVFNLFVKDNRNNIEYKFRIPELTPTGSDIAIEGNFNITINGTGITNSSSSESVTYDIYVKDRASHKSNIITSIPITIIK
ncbi:MAG: hypothetical protein H8E84_01275 [Flavobacteriales bacterium]|nr:hypothetical protein [Flavobacteriales bacterium]